MADSSSTTDSTTAPAESRTWPRLLAGAALLIAPLLVVVTSWTQLLANHPAYPLLLAGSAAVGLVLFLTGLKRRGPSGKWTSVGRWAGCLAAFGFAALLIWLKPLAATEVAVAALTSDDEVSVTQSRSEVRFTPAAETGPSLAFYPGGLVDPRAYAVLARALAAEGHQVVILKCPFDLALLCGGAAERVIDDGVWIVGGHSLGGTEAARDAAAVPNLAGLLLWASYPLDDISSVGLAAASISGSNDGLTTPSDINESRPLLPPETVFTEIEGAIHGHFGDYGDQPRDGVATIPRDVAQQEIIAASLAFLAAVTD